MCVCICVYPLYATLARASTLRTLQSYLTRDWEMGTGENGNLGTVTGMGMGRGKRQPAAGHPSVLLSVATHTTQQ